MREDHPKILCVDDEVNVLDSIKRTQAKKYKIDTALGAETALKKIKNSGPYPIVITDMNMPEINGLEFIQKAKSHQPNAIYIMLTGNADQQTAINAINQGNIFRFLCKPTNKDVLKKVIADAIKQYNLQESERILLRQTLTGSIKVLIDILSLSHAQAFSYSTVLKKYVHHIVTTLGLKNTWKYEMATMLSHLGCITLNPDMMDKVYRGQKLNGSEQEIYSKHPETAYNLLKNIPRLEKISQYIKYELTPFGQVKSELISQDTIQGSQILHAVIEYDKLTRTGKKHDTIIEYMESKGEHFDPKIVATLREYDPALGCSVFEDALKLELDFDRLKPGMFARQDIVSSTGSLLVPNGTKLTKMHLERLKNFSRSIGIEEPIKIYKLDDTTHQSNSAA